MADNSTLTSSILNAKGAQLLFALPTLFVSLTLTFAGTFLTLDKTRSFPSLGDPEDPFILDMPGSLAGQGRIQDSDKVVDWERARFGTRVPTSNPRFAKMIKAKGRGKIWRLDGGVGGLLSGYLFGVCIATFLTLFIVDHTTKSLSKVPFLIISFLSATICSYLAGRFHIVAIVCASVTGSFALATFAAFAVSLSTVGLLSIWAALGLVLLIIPIASLIAPKGKMSASLHWSTRVSQAAFGSMGMAFSIGVLARVPGWQDCLAAFWSSRTDHGSTLALSVMGWLLLVIGIGTDWVLYRTFGPSQDQTWDEYLSHYLDNLPSRAGKFRRLPSIWSRVSSIFKTSHTPLASSLGSLDEESLPSSLGNIPKSRIKRNIRVASPAVRFDLAGGTYDSDSETDPGLPPRKLKPGDKSSLSDYTVDSTLLGSGASSFVGPKIKERDDWTIDKYENEADIISNYKSSDKVLLEWKPAFLTNSTNKYELTNKDQDL